MIEETTSNWACVTDIMKEKPPLALGKDTSQWIENPREMLSVLSYYKFACKMIGPHKKVLDVGCREGVGTWVMAKECGFAKGIDTDAQAISIAQANFSDPSIAFSEKELPDSLYDGVVCFNPNLDLSSIATHVKKEGLLVVGGASLQQLEKKMAQHFAHIFLFSAMEGAILTGHIPSAPYFIALCCKKKTYSRLNLK